jgi:RimJ/RimL family protein N-acetyltransferase
MIQIRRLNPDDWDWIQRIEPVNWTSDTCGLVAVDDKNGKVVGAFVMYDFSVNSAYCHIIIENPMALRKKHLETVFDYVFNSCGLKILLGHVPSNNVKALRIDKKLGFRKHSWVKDGIADGVHEIKVILKREDCKYLRK